MDYRIDNLGLDVSIHRCKLYTELCCLTHLRQYAPPRHGGNGIADMLNGTSEDFASFITDPADVVAVNHILLKLQHRHLLLMRRNDASWGCE